MSFKSTRRGSYEVWCAVSDADRPPTDEQLRDALRPRGPVRFAVSEHEQPGATVVRVDGELDVLTAPQLAARLAAVTRRHRGDVVVDLRGTVFIDSVGLQVLLSAYGRLARSSRRLSVVCDEGPVRRVFERARLLETLGMVSSD